MRDKKLKIAVFYSLPSGGAIRALHDNVTHFKEKGHHVDMYTTDLSNISFVSLEKIPDNHFVFTVKRSKLRKFIFSIVEKITHQKFNKNSRAFISYGDFVNTQKTIAEIINNGNYDFVFLDQDNTLFTYTPAIAKYIKTLKIHYCHQPHRENEEILAKFYRKCHKLPFYLRIYGKLSSYRYSRLNVEYAQYMDYILCNSYFTRENILRVFGLNSKVSYLGVNTEEFFVQNLPRKNIILSVGSVSITKGFEFIIKSIAKVDKNIRPKFLIVGYASDIPWSNYLKLLAKKLNVDLEIINGISYEELVKLYNEVKMVIFAPYLEPFGLVPLEAFACGTPVIGVKEGGVKETVRHRENGLLLERDEDIFAQGITELLIDQELWKKCSEFGPEYVDNFWSINYSGEKLMNIIYEILEKENIMR